MPTPEMMEALGVPPEFLAGDSSYATAHILAHDLKSNWSMRALADLLKMGSDIPISNELLAEAERTIATIATLPPEDGKQWAKRLSRQAKERNI